ncbi:hypothetical protein ACFHW0_15925 [Micromonospora sp. LOL_025]|uniref:hypothetical protein n=1 Tax=Micromonospora sp. LOL_025 TaxID=3345413 RepID=UPI003A888321
MTLATSRRAPLLGLLVGHAVSLTGNMLTLIALPLYVLAETDSLAATGLAGAFATAPVVLGGAFGGVLVDRIGYRRASVLADLVSGVTIAAVPLLHATVGLPFPALLALVFVSGLLDTPVRRPGPRCCPRRRPPPGCRSNGRSAGSRPPNAAPACSARRWPACWSARSAP